MPTTPSRETPKARLAILVNTIAPYRLPVYAVLAETFQTQVLHGGGERNRTWALDLPPGVDTRQVWTLQVPMKKQTGVAGVWNTQYVHLNLGLLWWLPRARPDAILTNELGLRTVIALVYGRLMGVPVWVQWEGSLHSERHIGRFKRWLRGRLVREIRRWVSYGAASSEYLRSLRVSDERVLEVQNCVPHENFTKASEPGRTWFADAPRPVLLSVGQLIPRKGLDRLINACGRMAERGMEFTLVLVGQGPERERLEGQAARRGLRHFKILPNQDQSTLNEIYHSATAFILPSLEDVWGLVVSEAIWAGTPVLCSVYAGCAEIVSPQCVFDPMSDESFDEALAKVFDGTLHRTGIDKLATCEEVGRAIAHSIARGAPAEEESTMGPRVLALTGADRPE